MERKGDYLLETLDQSIESIMKLIDKIEASNKNPNISDILNRDLDNTGQRGIIPGSFLTDLEIAVSEFKKNNFTSSAVNKSKQNAASINTISEVRQLAFKSLFKEPEIKQEEEDPVRRKKISSILSSMPSVTGNPIASIINFCRHKLKIEDIFIIDEYKEENPDIPSTWNIKCRLPDGEVIGMCEHTRKHYAKKQAAIEGLNTLHANSELVKKYIYRILEYFFSRNLFSLENINFIVKSNRSIRHQREHTQ